MTIVAATPKTQESDLDMVKRHVHDSALRVAAQREVLVVLADQAQPTMQARELLGLFEFTWQAHVDHLAYFEDVVRLRALPGRRAGMRINRREAADQFRVRRTACHGLVNDSIRGLTSL